MNANDSTRVYETRQLSPDLLSWMFTELQAFGSGPVRGRYLVSEFDDARLIRATSSGGPLHVVRGHRHIAVSASEAFFACLPLRGETTLSQAGRSCTLASGDIALLDSRLEYELDVPSGGDTLWFRVAPGRMEARLGNATRLLARRIDGSSGLGFIASCFMKSLAIQVDHVGAQALSPLGSIATDLICEAVSNGLTASRTYKSSAKRTFERACVYIDQHLGEEELSPARIAGGVGISVRYLSDLFAAEKTSPMAWVSERRLKRCRTSLERQRWRPGLVTEVAFEHGFANISSFNRAFRAAFGCTPRDVTTASQLP